MDIGFENQGNLLHTAQVVSRQPMKEADGRNFQINILEAKI